MSESDNLESNTVDLSNCDREPIHIPGNVQSHGVLLAVDPDALIIEQVSDNCAALLHKEPGDLLGKNLADIVPDIIIEEMALSQAHLMNHPTFLGMVEYGDGPINVVGHIFHKILMVEFEPVRDGEPRFLDFQKTLRDTIKRIRTSPSLQNYAELVTSEIRKITGFDRVMFYRFQDDLSGEILGESMNQDKGLESYLGLRYPASDIPAQARRLFLQNIIRAIPNMSYTPARLEPEINPRTKAPLDMTHSFLRGVSPIHVEYLQNMGVDASMTLALEYQGELWGLIACHHYSELYVGYSMRLACEILSSVISLHVSTIQAQETAAYLEKINSTYSELMHNAANSAEPISALFSGKPNLLSLINADGVLYFREKIINKLGTVPKAKTVTKLANWLAENSDMGRSVFQTSNLFTATHGEIDTDGQFGGLLALSLGQYGHLLWFRQEQVKTVNWAGNPDKAVEKSPDGMKLSPRRSFAVWQQDVRHQSSKWLPQEIYAIRRLGIMIKEAQLGSVEALELLNSELATANTRLAETRDLALAANRAKSLFIANMSHEFRTPLNAVIGYAELLAEETTLSENPDTMNDLNRIQSAARHLLSLIQDVLDIAKIEAGEMNVTLDKVDLVEILLEAVSTSQWVIEKNHNTLLVEIPDRLPNAVYADAVRLRQVVVNLLGNAGKFTQNGTVKLSVEQDAEPAKGSKTRYTRIRVTDTGVGISPEFLPRLFMPFKQDAASGKADAGSGLGLAISRNLILNMNGDITATSVLGKGSEFEITLPIVPEK